MLDQHEWRICGADFHPFGNAIAIAHDNRHPTWIFVITETHPANDMERGASNPICPKKYSGIIAGYV